jgi:DNA-binding response OmpR family regulator
VPLSVPLFERHAGREAVLLVARDCPIDHEWHTALRTGGFAVDCVPDPDEALTRARDSGIGLAIIDVYSENGRGVALVRALRDEGNPAGLIVIAPAGDAEATVEALEAGADGCAGHTCSGQELVARLCALVRRPRPGQRQARVSWQLGDLRIDPAARCVFRGDEHVVLAPREFAVLLALLRRRGRAVSREALLRDVWRRPPWPTMHSIDALIRDLRCKLKPDKGRAGYIRTVRSGGYLIPL